MKCRASGSFIAGRFFVCKIPGSQSVGRSDGRTSRSQPRVEDCRRTGVAANFSKTRSTRRNLYYRCQEFVSMAAGKLFAIKSFESISTWVPDAARRSWSCPRGDPSRVPAPRHETVWNKCRGAHAGIQSLGVCLLPPPPPLHPPSGAAENLLNCRQLDTESYRPPNAFQTTLPSQHPPTRVRQAAMSLVSPVP